MNNNKNNNRIPAPGDTVYVVYPPGDINKNFIGQIRTIEQPKVPYTDDSICPTDQQCNILFIINNKTGQVKIIPYQRFLFLNGKIRIK